MQERKTLQQWLDERDMTQLQLAIAAKIDPSTVWSVLKAKAPPRLPTAQAIAKALGVSLDQIAWPEKYQPSPSHVKRKRKKQQQSKTMAPAA